MHTKLLGLGQMVEEDFEVLLGEAGHGKSVLPGGTQILEAIFR